MSYLDLISRQKQDKVALIINDESYTYAQLVQAVILFRESEKEKSKKEKVVFIHENSIFKQLIKFLAYSGTDVIPVIATQVSKNQEFKIENIPENVCMGVMTSGSTGKSKLLWRNYNSWADFFPQQNKIFGIGKDTIIFCQGSLAFTGNLNIYLGVFAEGGTIVATEKFLPKYWFSQMEKYHVNAIYMIPTKLLLLVKHILAMQSVDKRNMIVKNIISGSQSFGKDELEKVKAVFVKTHVVLYYGASELNYISYIKDKDMTEDKTIVGKPFKGVNLFVKQDEIFVDTPYAVEGISMPFSLKDKGYIDENNNLHFLGRKDDIYNVNGIKISCCKVEKIIEKVINADETALVKIHCDDVDILRVFLVSNQRKTKKECVIALKPFLTEFEMPKQFIYLDRLPKNESGKIDRLKLVAMNK